MAFLSSLFSVTTPQSCSNSRPELQHHFQIDGNPASWLPGHPKHWGEEVTRIDFKAVSTHHHLSTSDDGRLLSITVGPDIHVYTVDYPADSESESNLQFDIRLKRIFQSGHGRDVEFAEFGPTVDGTPKVLVSSGANTEGRRLIETVQVWNLDAKGDDDTNIPLAAEAASRAAYEVLLQNDTTHNVLWSQKAQNIMDGFTKALRIAQPQMEVQELKGVAKQRAFSRDGSSLLIFAPRPDHYISVVATDGLHERFRLKGHSDSIIWAEFSPDDKVIATSSWDETVRIWNATNGVLIHVLTGTTGQSWNGAFSPDSKLIAAGAGGGQSYIWNVETGGLVHTFKGCKDWVRSLAFSPNSQTLAAGAGDASVRIFGAQSGKLLQHWQMSSGRGAFGFGEVHNVMYTSRGLLIFRGNDGRVHIFDVGTGRVGLFEPREDTVGYQNTGNSIVSPDGNYLFTANFDGSVRVWKI